MNKTVLITIAVIVGLLALWLVVILFYPRAEEDVTEPTVESAVETTTSDTAGGSSGTVTATVQIVESLDDVETTAESDTTEAGVTIE